MYRNYKLNELRIENVGEEVTLSGWISKIRDKGHFVFIDLRDRYGVTQIFINEEVSGKELQEKVKKLEQFKNKFGVDVENKDELIGRTVMFEVKKAGGRFIWVDIKPLVKKNKKK